MFVPLFRTAGAIPRSIVLVVVVLVLVLELSSNDTFSPSTELYEEKLRVPVEDENQFTEDEHENEKRINYPPLPAGSTQPPP